MISKVMAASKLLRFTLLCLTLMPLQWVALKLNLPLSKKIPHFFNQLLARILGLKLLIEGEIPKAGLIVSNHVSWLDTVAFSAATQVSFIAKREVEFWPIFGAMAHLQRAIFINRERKRDLPQAIATLAAALGDNRALVLFPEGTTHNGKMPKEFKTSFFQAALAANAKVIPVTLVYVRQHGLPITLRQRPGLAWYGDMTLAPHLWDFLTGGPVVVKLIFHPQLSSSQFTNRKLLGREVAGIIKSALAENLHAAA